MSIASTIIKALSTPDSQERDWYGWATNQCSHTLFGVIIALVCPMNPYLATFIIASAKEIVDIYKVPTIETLRDSIVDTVFWMTGAILIAANPYLGILLLITFLSIGIISRIHRLPSTEGSD
jgi:hypothetical protein